jgi:hypothetical protein
LVRLLLHLAVVAVMAYMLAAQPMDLQADPVVAVLD